jgi:hypothetical protein
VSSESVSILKHPLNAGIHFFFVDELAARNLIQPDLNLLFEPSIIIEHSINSLLYQLVGPSSGSGGELVQFGLLDIIEVYFHRT